MQNFNSVEEVLDFAIKKEQEASDYYIFLSDQVKEPWMKDMFQSFSNEELKHKTKLQGVKTGATLAPSQKKIQDLKLADYIVDMEEGPGMNFQDALILAMKREKAAFKLYTDLADAAETEDLKNTFLALAQEEAKHKLYIETKYDDEILTDN